MIIYYLLILLGLVAIVFIFFFMVIQLTYMKIRSKKLSKIRMMSLEMRINTLKVELMMQDGELDEYPELKKHFVKFIKVHKIFNTSANDAIKSLKRKNQIKAAKEVGATTNTAIIIEELRKSEEIDPEISKLFYEQLKYMFNIVKVSRPIRFNLSMISLTCRIIKDERKKNESQRKKREYVVTTPKGTFRGELNTAEFVRMPRRKSILSRLIGKTKKAGEQLALLKTESIFNRLA